MQMCLQKLNGGISLCQPQYFVPLLQVLNKNINISQD